MIWRNSLIKDRYHLAIHIMEVWPFQTEDNGTVAGAYVPCATEIIPVALPFSALQFLTVFLAAIVVTHRSGGYNPARLRAVITQRFKIFLEERS